jgi:hypothetical protein
MKNMIKYVLIFVVGALVLSSCEDLESNYAAMTNDYDKSNTTYYIQYLNATQYYETAIDEDGLPTDIVTTVGVALQGAPQSSDVVVSLVVASESTLPSDAYTLSSNSITIPAGKTSGSVDLTVLADQMTENEIVDLVLNMDAGGAEAGTGAQLNYSLKRIKFCPLTDISELAGSYAGFDDWGYASEVKTFVDGENFMLEGLCRGWMTDYWGEIIITEDPLIVTLNPDGTLVIAEQSYMTTTWNGDPQPAYGISATGKWDNCEKTLLINYSLHQGGGVVTTFVEDIKMK